MWLRRAAVRRALVGGGAALLVSALVWLGWYLLAQDRQLAAQRQADDRDAAADLVVAAFERRLSALEQSPRRDAGICYLQAIARERCHSGPQRVANARAEGEPRLIHPGLGG